ncbi:hypothetical protein PVAP13_6KG140618 [Panicum virgatum]|uniref:RING-type domain-containing protein n=1 Tax=Panicum virgatum TaxID=38727 RepID=A0A8T0RCY9_PANVG|nr:hypothetical protein PVAP13_6KG140618 [Panicum virgatum]
MAQPDSAQESHAVVVIDVADDAEPRCCCVCTEPLEWVAVGRCGHRDVCAGCATRIRFFRHDRRCCICRTDCPTVLVTRADGRASGSRQQGFVLPSSRLPSTAAPGRKGSTAGSYWYHGATGAYFDDRRPYRAAVKLCVKHPPPPRPASQGAVAVSHGAPSSQPAAGADASPDAPPRAPPAEGCLRLVSNLILASC